MRRNRWPLSVLGLLTAVPLLIAIPAGTARADGEITYGKLWSSFTNVTTSTGRHVLVRVTAVKSHDSAFPDSPAEMHVQVWTPSRSESHSWSPVSSDASGFTYSADGYAELSPTTTPYYSIDLQFTPTSKTQTIYCSPNNFERMKKQTGRLSGMLFVDTHTKKWGTIGSRTREDFVFAPGSTMRVYRGYTYAPCAPGPTPCVRKIVVFTNEINQEGDVQGTFSATSTKRGGVMHGHLSANRTRTTSDSSVRRIDAVNIAAPSQTLRLNNRRATVTITTSEPGATGSAVAKATQPGYTDQLACGDGTHMRSTGYLHVRLTNGQTPLTFHTVVFGDIHVPDDTDGSGPEIIYSRR